MIRKSKTNFIFIFMGFKRGLFNQQKNIKKEFTINAINSFDSTLLKKNQIIVTSNIVITILAKKSK